MSVLSAPFAHWVPWLSVQRCLGSNLSKCFPRCCVPWDSCIKKFYWLGSDQGRIHDSHLGDSRTCLHLSFSENQTQMERISNQVHCSVIARHTCILPETRSWKCEISDQQCSVVTHTRWWVALLQVCLMGHFPTKVPIADADLHHETSLAIIVPDQQASDALVWRQRCIFVSMALLWFFAAHDRI